MDNALTDESYWNAIWNFAGGHAATPAPPNEAEPTTKWRDQAIAKHLGQTRRFLEVGAGGSPWPAFVSKKYNAESWGIDFSRPGLELAASAAVANNQSISLVAGDVFDRALLPAGYFDVVYSGGFVEHFPFSLPVMERLGELVKEDGVVVTAVPNLCGVNGTLQKLVDLETYNRHVVISPAALDAAHAAAGLVAVEPARFVGVIDLAAVNLTRLVARMPSLMFRALTFAFAKLHLAGYWIDERSGFDGGRWLAPMVGGIYRRARP
ncbi:MAG TPA: class I SAM-dependent methyltransferase [Polyangia bacterium]|nr:class I SAM-dependent methyltransferase [Polyangia bacterium]